MECRRPTVRTSQPQGAARLASGPFTRGLLVKPNIAARQDLVKYPTPTPGSGVAFGSGAFGPALLFSGAQASGAFSYGGTPVSVFSGLTSLTAVVTFRAASLATLFRLLAVWGSGASDEQWILQVTATGAASYGGYQDGSNHYIKQTADGVIQAGKLTTIVAHWPGGNSLQCFVNGQEFPITVENWSAGTLSYLSTGASTGIFQVGIGGDGYPINGDIYDYSVLTGPRTSADLKALSLNNWQLFAPRVSLINDSVLVAGGGSTTNADGQITASEQTNGVGASTVSADGSVSASGSLVGAGASIVSAAGSIAATAAVSGAGVTLAPSAGSIAATASVTGVGSAITATQASGSIAASANVSGVGASVSAADGQTSQVESGAGVGASTVSAYGQMTQVLSVTGITPPPNIIATASGSISASLSMTGATPVKAKPSGGKRPRRQTNDDAELMELAALLVPLISTGGALCRA